MQPDSQRQSGEPPESLVPAARAGDADAVARLFLREHPLVWRLCMGFLADRTEADDAAQDAMLHLLDQLDRFDARRPWATWRNTVVLNLCRDRLRRDHARRRVEDEAGPRELPSLLPDPAPQPHEIAARRELGELVARSLRHLSPREREVFVLHDLEGGATAEVADALSITESTVRVMLATARRRLRELLAPRIAGFSP
jgi:RNA polymerase sigma-70 factor (ECF subfamily)